MSKVGRNDLCPCGSGAKYKKCCLPKADAEARERLVAASRQREALEAEMRQLGISRRQLEDLADFRFPPELLDDGLDDLSNGVRDLIDAKRWDEALLGCKRLLEEFPDVHDGLEMSAVVHDGIGDYATSLDYWRRAIDFVEHPDRRPHYDQEVIDRFREDMRAVAAKAEAAGVELRAPVADDERAP